MHAIRVPHQSTLYQNGRAILYLLCNVTPAQVFTALVEITPLTKAQQGQAQHMFEEVRESMTGRCLECFASVTDSCEAVSKELLQYMDLDHNGKVMLSPSLVSVFVYTSLLVSCRWLRMCYCIYPKCTRPTCWCWPDCRGEFFVGTVGACFQSVYAWFLWLHFWELVYANGREGCHKAHGKVDCPGEYRATVQPATKDSR